MSDDRPDSEIFADTAAAKAKQDEAMRERLAARLRLISLVTLRGGIVFALIAAILALGKLAYTLPEHSYAQLLAGKAAGGLPHSFSYLGYLFCLNTLELPAQ